MQALHDSFYAGHVGIAKTLHAVQRMFWWPEMKKDIIGHVRDCLVCQRDKGLTQKPGGLLQPLQIPDKRWAGVSMDFIVQLPVTKRGHDAVLVCVDPLSKMTHMAATTTTVTAEGTARMFADHVIKLHGWPTDIVSDRDSPFAGKFTRELNQLTGVHSSMSTAFHPQSDGQTERVNRVLEDMLRHYVNATHTDWNDLLPMAEFAIDNAYHESIQNTPFMLNYGQHPHMPAELPVGHHSRVPAALRFTQEQQLKLNKAKLCLKAAQERQRRYAGRDRRAVSYDKGALVMLSTKNLNLASTAMGSKKLLPL